MGESPGVLGGSSGGRRKSGSSAALPSSPPPPPALPSTEPSPGLGSAGVAFQMSTRRSLSRQANLSSRITEEQINDLVLKLQAILPEARVGGNGKVSAGKVLQETCSYIRSLHREMDDLSERLTELLSTTDISSAQATVIRSLLM